MATKTEEFRRDTAAKGRVQIENPITKRWVKIDTKNGHIVDVKKTPGPFKGVAKK